MCREGPVNVLLVYSLSYVCQPAVRVHSGESSQTFGRCAIVAESHAICSNLDFWRFARGGGGGREGEKKKKEEEEEEKEKRRRRRRRRRRRAYSGEILHEKSFADPMRLRSVF